MAAWSRGYVADGTYGIAFQAPQTPPHLAMVCAMAGVHWPLRRRMHVADLGCGRGYVVNTLAAANPGWRVLGLDHNPQHVAEGAQLAALAELDNAHFAEIDLAALDDEAVDRLPPLDVAMVHGLWSWVSDAVRAGIVRLLSRRLKPGGLAYFGYNALPAAGEDFALQRLLRHLAGPIDGVPGGAQAAAARAMERLRSAAPVLPLLRTAMLQRLLAEPSVLEPAFVAHEFLTEHWRPVFHEELCAALAPARLEFVGSCNLFEALPLLYTDAVQRAVMADLPEGPASEFVKDLCLRRPFRADVFVRGTRRVDPVSALDRLHLAACRALPQESPSLVTVTGKAALPQLQWQAVRAALKSGPQAVRQLRAAIGQQAPHPAELLALLVGTQQVLPVFSAGLPAPAATRFNIAAAALHAPAGEGTGHLALASPAAAGGLPASAFDLTLVAALLQGADASNPVSLARRLAVGSQDRDPLRASRRIEEALAERLPVWKRFGVVPWA